jgi:hypothetical protein
VSATDTSSATRAEEQGAQAPAAQDAPTSGRSVSQLLGELGSALEVSFAARRRRFGLAHACAVAAVLLAAAVGVAAFALARPTARVAPRAITAVKGLVARGTTDGVAWALAVSSCPARNGGHAVSLVTGYGSTTTPCAGVARPASTLYDQAANVALVFGTAPAGTAKVEAAGSGGDPSTDTIVRQIPPAGGGGVFFVGAIPFAQTATAITAYGSGSRLLEACSEQRCVAP